MVSAPIVLPPFDAVTHDISRIYAPTVAMRTATCAEAPRAERWPGRRRTQSMIARMTPYHTAPDALEPLIQEIVALARSSSTLQSPKRRAELFLLDRSSGDALSVVIGDDKTVAPVIELGRPPETEPEQYDVRLLQVGGPTTSGVVEVLLGRVVHCDTAVDLSFDGDALPTSPDVWLRTLLVAPDRGRVIALAIASDRGALEETLRKFSARCPRIDDYDEVAYHFFVDSPREHERATGSLP